MGFLDDHINQEALGDWLVCLVAPGVGWWLGYMLVHTAAEKLGIQTRYGAYPKPNRAFFHAGGRP